jgi:hypothetical protein
MNKIRASEPEQDAFRQDLCVFHNGKDVCEIVETDDGYFLTRAYQVA